MHMDKRYVGSGDKGESVRASAKGGRRASGGGQERRWDERKNIWPGRTRASSRLISLQRRMQLFPSFINRTQLLVRLGPHCPLPTHLKALLYSQGQRYCILLYGLQKVMAD